MKDEHDIILLFIYCLFLQHFVSAKILYTPKECSLYNLNLRKVPFPSPILSYPISKTLVHDVNYLIHGVN